MRMIQYTFSISHVPGKSLPMADTLSRAPAPGGSKDGILSEEVEAYMDAVFECLPATERRLEEIHKHQEDDEVLQQIVKILPVWMARIA